MESLIVEAIIKTVNSKGTVTKKLDRETRHRRATQTTGLSPSARRLIAIKAARTRLHEPSVMRKAQIKTKKAMRYRGNYGI